VRSYSPPAGLAEEPCLRCSVLKLPMDELFPMPSRSTRTGIGLGDVASVGEPEPLASAGSRGDEPSVGEREPLKRDDLGGDALPVDPPEPLRSWCLRGDMPSVGEPASVRRLPMGFGGALPRLTTGRLLSDALRRELAGVADHVVVDRMSLPTPTALPTSTSPAPYAA
jgi:hypothetical protein